MKILALVTDAWGGPGGIARYNRDLLCALDQASSVESVVVLPRLAQISSNELTAQLPGKVRQHRPVFRQFAYTVKALQLTSAMPRDTVVFCGHLLMAPLAASLAKLKGLPLWLQVHGVEAWSAPTSIVRWGAEAADIVTSVSRYTRAEMITNWWRGDPSRIRVLPNTVDPMYSPGPKPPHLAGKHGREGRKVLLTVSRLAYSERYKGQDLVISALPQVLARHPDLTYVVVGSGDDIDRLKSVAAGNGVTERVVFTGQVPDHELVDYFRLADAFIMPSTKEGFGIVFLEAAACGLPVIAGNRDGSIDALADGATGTLIDPGDKNQIVDAVCKAIEGGVRPEHFHTVNRFERANYARHLASIFNLAASR